MELQAGSGQYELWQLTIRLMKRLLVAGLCFFDSWQEKNTGWPGGKNVEKPSGQQFIDLLD